ncbi:Elongation factor Ts [Candidatus Hartigia pinicola]|nr:Elongation factor Ts [Candidatus Hartigia pinicola]
MSRFTVALIKELRERTGTGMMECKKALVEASGDIEIAIDNMRKSGQAKAAKKACRVAAEGIILAEVFSDGQSGILIELNSETDFVAKDASFLAFGRKVMASTIADKNTDIRIIKTKFEDARTTLIAKVGENINIRRVAILDGVQVGSYVHGARIGVLIAAEGADEELLKHIAMHIAASKPEYITPDDVPESVVSHERQIQLDIAMQSGKLPKIAEKMVTGRMKKFTSEISLTGQPFIMDPSKSIGDLLKEKKSKIINFIRFEVGEGIEKIKIDFAKEVSAISK